MSLSPEKRRAKTALYKALRHGDLVRPDACEKCRKVQTHRGLDAHHLHGYDEDHWLDIEWLCQSCHNKIHGGPNHAGNRYTDEAKAKIASSLKTAYETGARKRPDLSGEKNPFYGRHHTNEARAAMSRARLARGRNVAE